MLLTFRCLTMVLVAAFMASLTAMPSSAEVNTAAPSVEAAEDPAAMATTVRYSYVCPNNSNRANFSYTPGPVTTRIYANNHCGRSVKVAVRAFDAISSWTECWTVPTGKTSRLITHGYSGNVQSMRFMGC